ncbi:hypothetical protein [Sinanaerobacter sp. ZZT-01]|uniref:hypothetical protein n=1 Tax=Sinanaerobacter sp. ZZT-01 TaxID=3111540 RepID=UPI002D79974F|nr:hypothetical protein [Sinanaerobacter sp. ZZT-01]WRR93389.1 hypothetical protein U5921_15370 [Sinanaerobacter sp. ZZT-01]
MEKPQLDLNFKLERVHYTILKDARKNNGFYDLDLYKRKVIEKHPDDKKMQRRLISWNQTTLEKMMNAGILKKEIGGYRLISDFDLLLKKDWTPGKNHIKLLQKNVDGIIHSIDLKREHDGKKEYEAKRQKDMITKMLRNLYENGYLERLDKGVYKITDKSKAYLDRNIPFQTKHIKKDNDTEGIQAIKITYFDRHIKDVLTDGKISMEKLKRHQKSGSIIKRIKTLEDAGLIIDGKPKDDLILKIDRVIKWSRDRELKLEALTSEQKKVVVDMRVFLNLSFTQIARYIYNNNKDLAYTDLTYLVKRRVLKKDSDLGIYVFDIAGIRLSNQMLVGKDVVRYKTKLESRKEEVEHDMLVYTAYQEFKKDIQRRGAEILDIKNDRQMRYEDAKKHGHMLYGYPDLRVEYKEKDSLKTMVHDIEIDCGYDGKTILSKIKKISQGNKLARGGMQRGSLSWYCNSVRQAAKVAKVLTQNTNKRTRPQQIYLFVLSRDGKVHKMRWQRELLNYR